MFLSVREHILVLIKLSFAKLASISKKSQAFSFSCCSR